MFVCLLVCPLVGERMLCCLSYMMTITFYLTSNFCIPIQTTKSAQKWCISALRVTCVKSVVHSLWMFTMDVGEE